MPVHPHHASESLEPERMRQAAKDAVRALLQDECLDHHGAEPRHPRREPIRHAAAVQGKECAAGTTHTDVQYSLTFSPKTRSRTDALRAAAANGGTGPPAQAAPTDP